MVIRHSIEKLSSKNSYTVMKYIVDDLLFM